jgi:carbamoyltransferase
VKVPVVVGINRTQDASYCVMSGYSIVVAIQKERLTREKHAWGKCGDVATVYREVAPVRGSVDVVVECYSCDSERLNMQRYHDELRAALELTTTSRVVEISHHLAHVYSCMPFLQSDNAAVMVVDFMGSDVLNMSEDFPGKAMAKPDAVEVSSFYHVSDKQHVRCVGKQLWRRDRKVPVGLGCFYYYLTQLFFPGEGNEGKVMGLSAYGDGTRLHLPSIEIDGLSVRIPDRWLDIFLNTERGSLAPQRAGYSSYGADLAAAGQRVFEEAMGQLADWVLRSTGAESLTIAGGTALNCVANSYLVRQLGSVPVSLPPAPHDGGTAVGCAIYGAMKVAGVRRVEWASDFLGPEQDSSAIEAAIHAPGLQVTAPENLSEMCAARLANGDVVALYHGRSELGPRALGHRSILANPFDKNTKDFINASIKGREAFRPLAPVVLLSDAAIYFHLASPSPFMQFAVQVRSEWRDKLAAITHIDGTARLQTITDSESHNLFLADVLSHFKRLTGIGVLLNTSLNGPGEPIVERPNEAVRLFMSTAIDALVLPPYIILKQSGL